MKNTRQVHKEWCDLMIKRASRPLRVPTVKSNSNRNIPGIRTSGLGRNELIAKLSM